MSVLLFGVSHRSAPVSVLEQLSIDEVIRQSGLPASAASVALLSLEMKRIIRQLPGKLFVKNQ